MNGIEEILNQIKEDAKIEEQSLKLENDEKIKKILEEADKEIEKISAETLEIIDKETRVETSKLNLKLNTLKRDLELTAKQDYVNELYKRASEKLSKLDKEAYISIFAPLLLEALQDPFISGKEVQIVFAKTANVTGDELLSKTKMKAEFVYSEEIKSGFIVKTDEVEIDCSGEKLINQSRKMTEKKVMNTLFE